MAQAALWHTVLVVEIGQAFDQLQRCDRRDQVFAHTPFQQLPVEYDVVGAADHDHFGACIAALREPVELRHHLGAREVRLDDDQVGRRALVIMRDGGSRAAHVHADVGLGEPTVGRRRLHHARGRGILAECLDRDAWDGPRLDVGRHLAGDVIGRRQLLAGLGLLQSGG
jgi:hypothetical protein